MQWYFILLIVVGALLVLYVAFGALVYFATFARQNKNPKLKYFIPEEKGLNFRQLEIEYCGASLYGGVYFKGEEKDCEKLVIFCHGYGPGHTPYMTEIARLCQEGFAVLSYDVYGCDKSQGNRIKGFYSGAECAVCAYISAKKDEFLKTLPTYLVGHSWGAYSALCASEIVNVNGVVAMSAFDKPGEEIAHAASLVLGGISRIFLPLFAILCKNKSSVFALEKSQTPALLIQGDKDVMVNFNKSAASRVKSANTQVMICKNKGHNPYNTQNAESKLAELSGAIAQKQTDEFFASFDYLAATEEDEEVMQAIINFINNN